jgi:hypothetical protein
VVAGIIEGFLSPSDMPKAIKFAIGIGTGIALYSYLLLAGRKDEIGESSAQPAGKS